MVLRLSPVSWSGYQELTDEQWSRLKSYLPYGSTGKRGRNANNRLFTDALLWMARSGGRWRDLPERFGRFDSVKRVIISGLRPGF